MASFRSICITHPHSHPADDGCSKKMFRCQRFRHGPLSCTRLERLYTCYADFRKSLASRFFLCSQHESAICHPVPYGFNLKVTRKPCHSPALADMVEKVLDDVHRPPFVKRQVAAKCA